MKNKKLIFLFLAIFLLGINTLKGPTEISILKDKTSKVVLNVPKYCKVYNENEIEINGKKQESYDLNDNNVSLYSNKAGKYKITAKLFGTIPINSYNVNVVPEIKLIPSGALIGVNLNTKGAIALEYEMIEDKDGKMVSPARDAKVMPGDIIVKIDGKMVYNAKQVKSALSKITSKSINMVVKRDDEFKDIKIEPVKAKSDDKYKIGLWVRDNIAGIGTLTCYSEDKKRYLALGHSINDSDTNILMPVRNGTIVKSELISVVKGLPQRPGELRGMISGDNKDIVGDIDKNNEYGIYGDAVKFEAKEGIKPMPIALQGEIKTGKAKILSTIDESGPKYYNINIKKVNKQKTKNVKSMMFEVTDPKLLSTTGGIVQGMSGSAIVQNGKIIGAVTHVFVNDPTKGYAIFIEWTLEDLLFLQF